MADTKKAQTAINLLHERVTQPIARANEVAATIRQAIINEGLTGQFTACELTALQNFVSDLATLAESSVVSALADRFVQSHRNRAITIPGVND